jgi:predicted metal-dependent phosphoesterase TrpH
MPTLLFITIPTEEVLNKEGKVRFPGSDKAVEQLTAEGWDVTVIEPTWPAALETARELKPDAILVSTYKRTPRSRDAASMLARMQDRPVYTVGVLQKDEAFRTMAPDVGVLTGIDKLPKP